MARTQLHRSALLLLAVILAGCGHTQVQVPDRPAFDKAINDYLKRKHMGLKILEYRRFQQEDEERATAVVALTAAAEGASQAAVQFVFRFTKQDSAWKVKSHRKK